MKFIIFSLLFFNFFIATSCGVKGRPLPPLKPREMGYGKPQYKGASKALEEPDSTEDKKKKKDSK